MLAIAAMRRYRLPAIPDPHICSAPDSPLRLSAIMCRDATLPGSGIATHRIMPGHPASHGCIRLPYDFAAHLFDLTKLGMRVIVAPSDVAPVSILPTTPRTPA
jgi:lipoprotein-anchoring transpeptidase ErfK/SrfK